MDTVKNYLIDMDGVLIRGMQLIPGAAEFIERLKARGSKFLVLTNNPIYTPGEPGPSLADHRPAYRNRPDLHLGDGHGAFSSTRKILTGRPA